MLQTISGFYIDRKKSDAFHVIDGYRLQVIVQIRVGITRGEVVYKRTGTILEIIEKL